MRNEDRSHIPEHMGSHYHKHENSFHDSMHSHEKQNHTGKKKITAKIKDEPGLMHIERQIHDGAIVISASLTIESGADGLDAIISAELEEAAHEINDRGGVVGHIKASVSATSTCMISVTDEKAMVKDSPRRRARISLAAIVFLIDPEDAESIIRKALDGIRTRLQ